MAHSSGHPGCTGSHTPAHMDAVSARAIEDMQQGVLMYNKWTAMQYVHDDVQPRACNSTSWMLHQPYEVPWDIA